MTPLAVRHVVEEPLNVFDGMRTAKTVSPAGFRDVSESCWIERLTVRSQIVMATLLIVQTVLSFYSRRKHGRTVRSYAV